MFILIQLEKAAKHIKEGELYPKMLLDQFDQKKMGHITKKYCLQKEVSFICLQTISPVISRALLEMSHLIFPASLSISFLLLFEFEFALI